MALTHEELPSPHSWSKNCLFNIHLKKKTSVTRQSAIVSNIWISCYKTHRAFWTLHLGTEFLQVTGLQDNWNPCTGTKLSGPYSWLTTCEMLTGSADCVVTSWPSKPKENRLKVRGKAGSGKVTDSVSERSNLLRISEPKDQEVSEGRRNRVVKSCIRVNR
jgi:hypothetical protein